MSMCVCRVLLTGFWSGSHSVTLNLLISDVIFFLWPGLVIPIAVRSFTHTRKHTHTHTHTHTQVRYSGGMLRLFLRKVSWNHPKAPAVPLILSLSLSLSLSLAHTHTHTEENLQHKETSDSVTSDESFCQSRRIEQRCKCLKIMKSSKRKR